MTGAIDPTTVEIRESFRVSDKNSHYYGFTGEVQKVYEDRLTLVLDEASPVAHVKTFDLDQLERA